MTRMILVAIVCSLLSFTAQAQTHGAFPAEMYSRLQSPTLHADIAEALAAGDTLRQDLIVGYPNPNEIRDISGSMTVLGDIIVANNAQLRLDNADITLHGNIFVVNNGKLLGTGGTLRFVSHFRYERSILMLNKSALALNGTTIDLGGFNIGCGLADTSIVQLGNMAIQGGVMTTTVTSAATFEAIGSGNLGEILFFDRTQGAFESCNGLLTWTTAPDGSNMDITYPGPNVSGSWAFPDSAGAASGVDYRITYQQCNTLLWGLIHEDGSTVHVRESQLLACGALINGPGQVEIAGLVNNTMHQSYRFPAADRDVAFTNTRVGAWNLYPRGTSNVLISNCILGEVLCMGSGNATMSNSICDGTGGFAGANDASTLLLVNCQIIPDLIARQTARIITSNSTITNGNIVATDNAVVALLNTAFSAPPVVSSGSAALVASIDEPSNGYVGAVLPVYGSVRLFRGEELPIIIDSWWVDFGLAAIPDDRRPVAPRSGLERYREKLTDWDTDGLKSGQYALYLTVRLSTDDTLAVARPVSLINAPVSVPALGTPAAFSLGAPYPNPVTAGADVAIDVQAASSDEAFVRVFDINGREVVRRTMALNSNNTVLFVPTRGLPPGAYYGTVGNADAARQVFTFQVTQ